MSDRAVAIDLNADLGEGAAHDAELMPLVSSANVCCGAHAGGGDAIVATVRLALRHGVAIGAHPGHADREHFGRRELAIEPGPCAALVDAQIAAVAAVAGPALHHVKLHGGLYHQVGRERRLADAVATLLAHRWPRLVVYAAGRSLFGRVAREHGLAVADEAFVDRGYAADGTLVARDLAGACIEDPAEAAARAVRLACGDVVPTTAGGEVRIAADTLCIHGDGRRAVEVAMATRAALLAAGVVIRPAMGRAHPT
jgi:UPF0271 protein